jgi:hypothetical protein
MIVMQHAAQGSREDAATLKCYHNTVVARMMMQRCGAVTTEDYL